MTDERSLVAHKLVQLPDGTEAPALVLMDTDGNEAKFNEDGSPVGSGGGGGAPTQIAGLDGTTVMDVDDHNSAFVTLRTGAGGDAIGGAGTDLDQPAGGTGILGFLSGIYDKATAIAASVAGTLTVSGTVTAAQATAANLKATTTDSGTNVTGVTLATGSGLTGWLSRIVQVLTGTLTVDGSGHTQPVSGTVTANDGGTNVTGVTLATGSGITGWLSRIVQVLTGTLTVDASGHTQPVSGTLTTNDGGTNVTGVTLASGSGLIGWLSRIVQVLTGTLTVDGSGHTQPVSGTFWQATQPVSGTVTSNDGGAAGTAHSADASFAEPTTGTGITGYLSGIYQRTKDIRTFLAGTITVDGSGHTQPVSGTVTANDGGTAGTAHSADNSFAQPTTGVGITGYLSGIYQRVKDIRTSLAGTLTVDGSGHTQPVSGTVTSNDGGTNVTGVTLATGSGLTGWLSRIVQVLTGTLTVSGTVTSNDGGTAGTAHSADASFAEPTTGVGALGYLSGIYQRIKDIRTSLAGTLTVSGTVTSNDGGTNVTGVTLATGSGVIGWLSRIVQVMTGTLTVTQAAQTSSLQTLCTNVTNTSTSAGVSFDGYNGAIMVEFTVVDTGVHSVTFKVKGSYDNTNFYDAGFQEVDAVTSPSRVTSLVVASINGTVRGVVQVLDAYKYYAIQTTANTLVTGLTCKAFANPI